MFDAPIERLEVDRQPFGERILVLRSEIPARKITPSALARQEQETDLTGIPSPPATRRNGDRPITLLERACLHTSLLRNAGLALDGDRAAGRCDLLIGVAVRVRATRAVALCPGLA